MTSTPIIEKRSIPQPLQWWTQARFGMFIHWGLYSQLAGFWQGQPVERLGEWIMHFGKIPPKEYEKVASQFNPALFDVDSLVRLAKDAGMKYLVMTAKHHDGFALYDSACSEYNIVASTPFARDPIAELATACKAHGIRLCFYYSQSQDWHHPGGLGHWQRGENWKRIHDPEAFENYLQKKVKPQLRELLTQYGPIGLIWFDTPLTISKEHSLELKAWVKSFQPDCLVCGRIGNNIGDYNCLGDNMIPIAKPIGLWETPATINDTWGYKSDDHQWKSTRHLLHLLVDLASKGVNYLLNIGPDGEGVVPKPSVDRLLQIGAWMKANNASIYGTQASPFALQPAWGRITRKHKTIFLHVFHWPKGQLQLSGLRTKIKSITLLAQPDKSLAYEQTLSEDGLVPLLTITLPALPPDRHVSVLRVELLENLDVDDAILEQPGQPLMLTPLQAAASGPSPMHYSRNGSVHSWTDHRASLQWEFKLLKPGRFRVEIASAIHTKLPWQRGQHIALDIHGQMIQGELKKDRRDRTERTQYQKEVISVLGEVHLDQLSLQTATLRLVSLPQNARGLELSHVRMERLDPLKKSGETDSMDHL